MRILKPSPQRVVRIAGNCKGYFSWAWISPQGKVIEVDNHDAWAREMLGPDWFQKKYNLTPPEARALYDMAEGKFNTQDYMPLGHATIKSGLDAPHKITIAVMSHMFEEGWIKASNYRDAGCYPNTLRNTTAWDAFFLAALKCLGRKNPLDEDFSLVVMNPGGGRADIRHMGFADALEKLASESVQEKFFSAF